MTETPTVKELAPRSGRASINLRDLGFVGNVSPMAREEIAAADRRAQRAIQTAHLYWFD